MQYTCSRCYRVLIHGNRDDYLYRLGDIEIRLCHECWYNIPNRDMPGTIRLLAERVGRRLSIEQPGQLVIVDERPSRYVIPPKVTAWKRLTGILVRSF